MDARKGPPPAEALHGLSPRIARLRARYFDEARRAQSNALCAFTTGAPWDAPFDAAYFCAESEAPSAPDFVDESLFMHAQKIDVPKDFYQRSIAERRACFVKAAVAGCVPQALLPGELIAGEPFRLLTSHCLNRAEARSKDRMATAARERTLAFLNASFGGCGAVRGHLLADYPEVLQRGFAGIAAQIRVDYDLLSKKGKAGPKGARLRAMLTACSIPVALAAQYAALCDACAQAESDPVRRAELIAMRRALEHVPKEPARDFYEAVQSLWLTHMLALSDEGCPGFAVALGRIDQYLLPYWQTSIAAGMTRAFGRELLQCFLLHCGHAFDAMRPHDGQRGATDREQILCLSGLGADGRDRTNELTYVFLEAVSELGPLPAAMACIRLHRNTPEKLLEALVERLTIPQGAPFLISFDERCAAGLREEARRVGLNEWSDAAGGFGYAVADSAGNVACAGDRLTAAACSPHLAKAVELALGNGRELKNGESAPQPRANRLRMPKTGDPRAFTSFTPFYEAFFVQLAAMLDRMARSDTMRAAVQARFLPAPYLDVLVRDYTENALDTTAEDGRQRLVTVQGGAFVTAVNSLLAVKNLVFEREFCTMATLISALEADWTGYETLRAMASHRSPRFGHDDDAADALAGDVLRRFAELVYRCETKAAHTRFRPGLLSAIDRLDARLALAATPDGRASGEPVQHVLRFVGGEAADAPTAGANSMGKALGGADESGALRNALPGGASHILALSPALLQSPEQRCALQSFLRGYVQNGGPALQIDLLDGGASPGVSPCPKARRVHELHNQD